MIKVILKIDIAQLRRLCGQACSHTFYYVIYYKSIIYSGNAAKYSAYRLHTPK